MNAASFIERLRLAPVIVVLIAGGVAAPASDGGPGADSIQSFFGLDIDILEAWR
jgi:hypothetical protein